MRCRPRRQGWSFLAICVRTLAITWRGQYRTQMIAATSPTTTNTGESVDSDSISPIASRRTTPTAMPTCTNFRKCDEVRAWYSPNAAQSSGVISYSTFIIPEPIALGEDLLSFARSYAGTEKCAGLWHEASVCSLSPSKINWQLIELLVLQRCPLEISCEMMSNDRLCRHSWLECPLNLIDTVFFEVVDLPHNPPAVHCD